MAQAPMLSTLLATKLNRPRPSANLVARPRLTERLDAGLRNGHRLILVVAPAGCGKTTLVAGWMCRVRRLAHDCKRLAATSAGLHFGAFAMLMAHRFVAVMVQNA